MKYYGIRELYPRINQINHHLALYTAMMRPFTLVAPLIAGILGVMIERAYHHQFNGDITIQMIIAGIVMVLSQAVGQMINQMTDIKQDEINKPYRPFVNKSLTIREGVVTTSIIALLAIFLSFLLSINTGLLILTTLFFAIFYSVEPIRIKRRSAFGALVWMSLSRGLIPFLAAWSVYSALDYEFPLVLGICAFLWVMSFQATKDFPDYQGDRMTYIPTLPVKYTKPGAMNIMVMLFAIYIVISDKILPSYLEIVLVPQIIVGILCLYFTKTELYTQKMENNVAWLLFYAGVGLFYLTTLIMLI